MQNRTDIHTIPILGQSLLCPYKALKQLLQHSRGEPNDPLFTVPRSHGVVHLTNSITCRHLHTVSQTLFVSPPLKFHDFRRSGATWAFHNGVPLHQIMHHGTWKSDSRFLHFPRLPTYLVPCFGCLGAPLHLNHTFPLILLVNFMPFIHIPHILYYALLCTINLMKPCFAGQILVLVYTCILTNSGVAFQPLFGFSLLLLLLGRKCAQG